MSVPSIPVNSSVRLPRLSLACCELVIVEDEVVRHREALAAPVGSGTGAMSAHHTCVAGGKKDGARAGVGPVMRSAKYVLAEDSCEEIGESQQLIGQIVR